MEFFVCVVFSYYVLPEGILKGKNPLHNWDVSSNTLLSTVQIFSFNLLSVLVMIVAGLFGQKKLYHQNYLSIGYVAFFSLIILNAIVLGTWSFSMTGAAIPLSARFLRTFDLMHRSGLWEMFGQMLIVCATAHISIILTNGKETQVKHIKQVRLSKAERNTILIGLALMIVGAFIEGVSINAGK